MNEQRRTDGRRIPILMAFDRGFLMPSAVAMVSVMENSNRDTEYHFIIMTETAFLGMDGGLFERLRERYPNYSYEYLAVDDPTFHETHRPFGVASRLAFVRLLAAEILTGLDACLYLDGDLIARSDLAVLWQLGRTNERFDALYFMGVPDLSMQNGSGIFWDNFVRCLGTTDLDGYVNTGVLVMNLKKLREDRMVDVFRQHAQKDYVFGDQDILNLSCKGKIGMLPVSWNMCPRNIYDESMLARGCMEWDKEDLMAGRADILHYAGEDKPWKCVETAWEYEWLKYAQKLPECEMTKEYQASLSKINSYDEAADRMEAVRRAKRYVLYGFTYISRFLLDQLTRRGIGTPWCFCDGDPEKRGQEYGGVPCLGWEDIREQADGDTVVILCAQKAWPEIRQELLDKGVDDRRILRYRKRDFRIMTCESRVNVGLLMGVFDLFHIGHLNLIRRAKEKCRYLRVGVLSDNLVEHFKSVRPAIPQQERMAILSAIRDVDEVVLLEQPGDVSRLNEWRKRPFDAFFSGDDYRDNEYWKWEKQELNKLGADIVFFPYTKQRSSSMIRRELGGKERSEQR